MTRQADADVTHAPPLAGACCYCGELAQGHYDIHETEAGFLGADEPIYPLCDTCGGHEVPTCAEIWARIAARWRR